MLHVNLLVCGIHSVLNISRSKTTPLTVCQTSYQYAIPSVTLLVCLVEILQTC